MNYRQILGIDVVARRAQIFGTASLEIMMVIAFLLATMLAALSWAYDKANDPATEPGLSPHEEPALDSSGETPEEVEDRLDEERKKLGAARRELRKERREIDGERKKLDEERREVSKDRKEIREERLELDREREDLADEREEAAREADRPSTSEEDESPGHRWPPIIRLPESDGYKFRIGSSDLTRSFRRTLMREVCDRIIQIANDFEADVIEVIGHTDEQPYPPSDKGNLDRTLIQYMNGKTVNVVVTNNVGLGMARAASVAKVLRECLRSAPGGPFMVVALSAGQTLLPRDGGIADGRDSGNNPDRRTIEIRVRRRDTRDTTN